MIDRKGALGALIALLVISSAGVSAQTQPYKIGLTWPLTGPLANSGTEYIVGAQLAVARLNASGGVNGHQLVLDVEDSMGTPPGGVTAMRKLVEVDGCQAILTEYTNVVGAQVPLADQLKVPILANVQAPGLMSHSPYTFAHAETVSATANLIGAYWKNHNFKRIYAFLPNNALGPIMSGAFKAAAAAAGVQYDEAMFNPGDSDYRGVVARAKDFNPDGVLDGSPGGLDGTVIIRQVREAGITVPIFLPGTFINEPGWKEGVGSYIEGIVMAELSIDPVAGKAFLDAFRAKSGGKDPSYLTGEVWDETMMMAAAIAKSSYNGDAIAKQLAVLKGVPSVFGGTITMDPDHYSVPATDHLSQYRSGKLVPVK